MRVERVKIADIIQSENSRGAADRDIASLMSSIQQHGLQEPIGVTMEGKGSYKIMYGNRRLNACIKLGHVTIPVVLYTNINDADLLVHNAIENIQRKQITPAELGRICEQLEVKHSLTPDQIAARLSMPPITIKAVMDIYKRVPAHFREKVSFQPRGMKKNGRLSVSAATRIANARTNLGLNKKSYEKLLEHARLEELSNEDIKIISFLVQEGMTLAQAEKRRDDYKSYRLDVIALKDEVEQLAKNSGFSTISYLTQIVYGKKSPITKPSFINFKTNEESNTTKGSRKRKK